MEATALSPLVEAQTCLHSGECARNPTETCTQCGQRVCERHICHVRVPPDAPRRLCYRCLQAEGFFDEEGYWVAEAGVRML